MRRRTRRWRRYHWERRVARWSQRHPRRVAVVAVVALVGMLGNTWVTAANQRICLHTPQATLVRWVGVSEHDRAQQWSASGRTGLPITSRRAVATCHTQVAQSVEVRATTTPAVIIVHTAHGVGVWAVWW